MIRVVHDTLLGVVATQSMCILCVTLVSQGVEEFAEDDGGLIRDLIWEEGFEVGCHCNSRMAC